MLSIETYQLSQIGNQRIRNIQVIDLSSFWVMLSTQHIKKSLKLLSKKSNTVVMLSNVSSFCKYCGSACKKAGVRNAQFRQFIFDSIMSNTAIFQTVYENQFFAGKTFPDPNWTFQQKLDFLKDAIGTDFVLFSVSNYLSAAADAYRYLKTHIDINAYKLSAAADETEFATSPSVISSVWNCINGDNYKIRESFSISEWDLYGSKRLGMLSFA